MNRSFKYLLIPFLSLNVGNAFCQQFYDSNIHLGQAVDSVEKLVGQEVQGNYGAGSYLLKMSAQTVDYKGKTKEVILRKENVLFDKINKGLKLNIHFVIEGDTLARVITEYPNLTLDEVRRIVLPGRVNMSGFYFNPGYKSYYHLYTASNGIVVSDYKKTIITEMSAGVREQLRMIAGIW